MNAKMIAGIVGGLVTIAVTSYYASKAGAKAANKEQLNAIRDIVKDTPVNITINCEDGIDTKAEVVEKSTEEKHQ